MSGGEKAYSFKFPEEKKISIDLCGKTFLISSHFSMNDMELYFDALDRGDSAKSALADIIYLKLQKCESPIPAKDKLHLEDDNAFEPYIAAVVNENDDLQKLYLETDVALPITERFAISYRQYWDKCTKNLAEAMKPMLKVTEQISRSIDFSWVNRIQQVMIQYQPMIDMVAQTAQRAAEIFAPIQKTIAQYANIFSDAIANIQIPTFTEEQKRKLEENYKEWGKLGWSVIPHAPLNLFNESPLNAKDADKIALPYFSNKGIAVLIF